MTSGSGGSPDAPAPHDPATRPPPRSSACGCPAPPVSSTRPSACPPRLWPCACVRWLRPGVTHALGPSGQGRSIRRARGVPDRCLRKSPLGSARALPSRRDAPVVEPGCWAFDVYMRAWGPEPPACRRPHAHSDDAGRRVRQAVHPRGSRSSCPLRPFPTPGPREPCTPICSHHGMPRPHLAAKHPSGPPAGPAHPHLRIGIHVRPPA